MATEKCNGMTFFKEAAGNLEPEQIESIRAIHRFFRDRNDKITWESKANKHCGFGVGLRGVCQDPILRVYSDGRLHFYTSYLDRTRENQARFRDALESFLKAEFGANISNGQHFQIAPEAWCSRVEELLTRSCELLPAMTPP